MIINRFFNIIILTFLLYVIILAFINYNTMIKKRIVLDDGVMLWYNQPSTVFYNDSLYYSYLGIDKKVKIGKFSNSENNVKALYSYDNLDDHASPSIWVIQNGPEKGKIISFSSWHSTEMYLSKSKKKEDITTWENVQVFDKRKITYNSVGETSTGKIFVFYTVQSSNNRTYVYRESVDGAVTWSKPKVLIDFANDEYIYAAPVLIEEENITISFTSYREILPDIGHKNIYLLRSEDSGKSWYQTNDKSKKIVLPLTKEKSIPIVKTNLGRENVVWDLKYDRKNNPVIAFVDHAPFSSKGWSDTVAKVISFDKKNNMKINEISKIDAFVYLSGIRINPNNTNNFIIGVKYKGKSKLFTYYMNSKFSSISKYDIFNSSKGYEMNPVFPYNSNDKYLFFMDVTKYFNKKYNSKIVLSKVGVN